VLLSASIYLEAKEWRGIVPLVSTREDVEKRLLGPPVQPCRFEACFYETEQEHVFIHYSRGPCPKDEFRAWNVPRGTVLSVRVSPKKRPLLSELHLDLSKYERTEDPELAGAASYDSEEEGIFVEADLGVVYAITYMPTARDEYLRCPPAKEGVFTRLGQPCPTVRIEAPRVVIRLGKTITLNAAAVGLRRAILPTYTWSASAGAIATGQGTSTVTIDTRGLSPQTITITVEVVPFPEECRNRATYTFKLTSIRPKLTKKSHPFRRARREPTFMTPRAVLFHLAIAVRT
jgi:hypothetical protein